MSCILCAQASGHYDFNQLCCRVRYLLTLPNLEARRAWLDQWRRQGDKAIEETEAALTAAFKDRKKKSDVLKKTD